MAHGCLSPRAAAARLYRHPHCSSPQDQQPQAGCSAAPLLLTSPQQPFPSQPAGSPAEAQLQQPHSLEELLAAIDAKDAAAVAELLATGVPAVPADTLHVFAGCLFGLSDPIYRLLRGVGSHVSAVPALPVCWPAAAAAQPWCASQPAPEGRPA